MKIENLKLKIGLLIGLLSYLFINQATYASSLSLSLDPSIIEINALPPSVATSTLSIQNKSDNLVHLQILLKPFKAKFENGELEYLNLQDSFLTQNVQILDGGVPVEGIVLGPKQQKNLTLNVNIPQDPASPQGGTNISARPPATSSKQANTKQAGVAGEVGPARQSNAQAFAGGRDYYFSIIFVSQSTASPTSTSSSNRLGIASNVLLSVGAKEMPDGIIQEFSVGPFYESGPVPFTLRVKNNGTHFIKPKGEILIKNMFGQNIGKLDLVAINILSQSIRAIPDATYMQELRSQDNSKAWAKSDLDFAHPKALWKEDFLLGFYTATLNIALSNEGPIFTKSIRFFAFPFQGLIVIVIVLISAIIIVNRVRSRMSRRDALGKK